ncbi:hypothetical protein G3N56_07740 [Desulfovibrio sulfodismutans]|uniref:Uncharacterized protein n=1 Tax=Desulfolutivibrio sulfodismutans TaxID=63561 RepID=A0A7K3NLB3_9BACT|nr:hypothetical protein [Desulfolutivibrio sulfodismutans]NDY56633.1 hypothetical protein [Desulfolutivibrio sulfodismutans]QLA11266.1 hypothetical protein GD606_02715 [Desulfolutivibrio sulfodismutans DSM 3696]
MIDLYLHAPTREALLADLAPLGLAVDGKLVTASHVHALAVVMDDADGVTVAVRCLDDALAGALSRADFAAGTSVVERPEHAPVLAGGDAPGLDAVKAAACVAIDAEAERRRLLVLTPGAGQSLEYQHTAEEAARAVAAPDPLDPAAYPFLAAEQEALEAAVGVVTLREVAAAVLADRAAWLAYGAAVKAVRRRGKLLVCAAASHLAVLAESAGIEWPDVPGA